MRAITTLAIVASLALGIAPARAQTVDPARVDAHPSPAWLRDGVIYELNVRTFSPSGTFAGVTARLADLQKLGVSVIWLMPIHPIGQAKKKGTIGSPYAVRDYYGVNPTYGTKDDLKRLVDEAHRRGLKVILDVVANHTSWDNAMMATPAYYKRDAQGHVLSPYDWTDVAALDYGNPATRTYMTDVLTYWIREFDFDGFRCDVAFEVPTDYWEQARAAIQRVKPDVMLLAEAHKPELLVKAFDIDYSWPLHAALTEVAARGRSATAIRGEWEAERATYPRGALHLRISDDHDETRAIARFGERGALAASALMFALDGVPLLYNGMEVGDVTESGAPALFERLPVFWQIGERRPQFAAFYRDMIPLRRAHAALREGATTWLHNTDEDRVVTFLRRDDREDVLVAVNLSNRPFIGTVEASGPFTEITPGADARSADVRRPAALPALALDAWGFRIFHRAR